MVFQRIIEPWLPCDLAESFRRDAGRRSRQGNQRCGGGDSLSWRTAVAQSCLQGSQSTTPSRSPSTSSISSTSTSSVAQGCGKPSGPCDREACALAQPCNPRVPALLTCLCSRIDRAQAVVACILSILGTMNISTGLEACQAACTAQAL